MSNKRKYLPLQIKGVGTYIPDNIIPNTKTENDCGLDGGWCKKNYGIEQRHWATNETQAIMGAKAAQKAIENSDMELWEIDLILNASGSFQQLIPDNAPLIQRELNLDESGIPCLTIQSLDMGFLTALENCASMLTTGRYENILIICSEIISLNLDVSQHEAYSLYGDGAAAVVVSLPYDKDESYLMCSEFGTFSNEASCIQSAIGLKFFQQKSMLPKDLAMSFDLNCYKSMGSIYLEKILNKFIAYKDSVECIIPPQTGIFQSTIEDIYNVPMINSYSNLGYCGSASLPLALNDAIVTGRISRGMNLLLLSVGAGISVGGILLKY